jgi:hypothetical protein
MLRSFAKISAGADRGPHSQVCAHLTSAQTPINTSVNFSAHVSVGGGYNFFWKLEPYDNPFLEKNNPERREKEKEKNAVNSGHLVPCKHMQAARTNNKRLGPLALDTGR